MTLSSSGGTAEAPTISVVISNYNYGHFLGEAIESVLAQTYENLDIVVSDDGSTDDTQDVVRSFGNRVRYNYQENGGIAASRNTGIKLTSTEYLSFLDADDIWEADKLALQFHKMCEDPGLDIVYGHARQFISSEVSAELRSRKGFIQEIIPAPLSCSMLIKRSSFEKVGLFRTLPVGVDQEWYMRSVDLGLNSLMLPDVLFNRRIHESNNGIRASEADKRMRLHIIKEALDRRRSV